MSEQREIYLFRDGSAICASTKEKGSNPMEARQGFGKTVSEALRSLADSFEGSHSDHFDMPIGRDPENHRKKKSAK
jgi:hypothetical protein